MASIVLSPFSHAALASDAPSLGTASAGSTTGAPPCVLQNIDVGAVLVMVTTPVVAVVAPSTVLSTVSTACANSTTEGRKRSFFASATHAGGPRHTNLHGTCAPTYIVRMSSEPAARMRRTVRFISSVWRPHVSAAGGGSILANTSVRNAFLAAMRCGARCIGTPASILWMCAVHPT